MVLSESHAACSKAWWRSCNKLAPHRSRTRIADFTLKGERCSRNLKLYAESLPPTKDHCLTKHSLCFPVKFCFAESVAELGFTAFFSLTCICVPYPCTRPLETRCQQWVGWDPIHPTLRLLPNPDQMDEYRFCCARSNRYMWFRRLGSLPPSRTEPRDNAH